MEQIDFSSAYYSYACQNCNKEELEMPVVKDPREKSIILARVPMVERLLLSSDVHEHYPKKAPNR